MTDLVKKIIFEILDKEVNSIGELSLGEIEKIIDHMANMRYSIV